MKIYFYENWKETPEAYNSPVSVAGIKPKLKLDTAKSNVATIFYYIDKFNQGYLTTKPKFLIMLKDKDYHNEFIGDIKECIDFIRICLSDEDVIKEKIGRKKVT